MSVIEPWICPSCLHSVSSRYCPACGECSLNPEDLTFRSLFNQLIEVISSIDSRLILSFRKLIGRPGALTLGYQQGQRKQYVQPISLFLFANVLFFSVQTLVKMKIFATSLDMHLHDQPWGALAQQLVIRRLAASGSTLEHYAPIFDQTVALNAKTLVALMVLPFALLLPVVFFRNKKPFAVHMVFSLHFFTFLMLLWSGMLAVAMTNMLLGGAGLESRGLDHALSIIQMLIGFAYLYFATRVVYGTNGLAHAVKCVVLVTGVACIFLGYRFTLFLITLYTT